MRFLLLLILLLPLLAACAMDGDPQEAPAEAPAVEGPALIMFYTDN